MLNFGEQINSTFEYTGRDRQKKAPVVWSVYKTSRWLADQGQALNFALRLRGIAFTSSRPNDVEGL